MSWLLIFLSSYVPIVMLFFLVLMNWPHGETQSNEAHAGLRGSERRRRSRRGGSSATSAGVRTAALSNDYQFFTGSVA